jgi:RNA polymerase sigma-70 factor (ECF subfamily)
MDEKKTNSDAELIEMAKKNPESFGILMERYQGPLFHYIRRIAQLPKEDTEDLLQEVFIKIYQKLNEYNEELKFSSWAYRIAHNHVIDHFRKMNARPRTNALEDGEWEKIVHSSINLTKNIADKDCVEKIKSCIRELSIHQREALILRFVEEKEYEEIMDILKKPKGTVATLISRGKETLVKNMKEKNIDCF